MRTRHWSQELAAPVALQRIALGADAGEARGAGVAALARLLWAGGAPAQRFPGLSHDRAGLLAAARPHLTAAEQARARPPRRPSRRGACLGACQKARIGRAPHADVRPHRPPCPRPAHAQHMAHDTRGLCPAFRRDYVCAMYGANGVLRTAPHRATAAPPRPGAPVGGGRFGVRGRRRRGGLRRRAGAPGGGRPGARAAPGPLSGRATGAPGRRAGRVGGPSG